MLQALLALMALLWNVHAENLAAPESVHSEMTGQVYSGSSDSKAFTTISKKMAIAAAKHDLPGFCQWNRLDRAASGLLAGDPDKSIEGYRRIRSTGNLDAAAEYLLHTRNPLREKINSESTLQVSPVNDFHLWDISMMGHPTLKLKVPEVKVGFNVSKATCSDSRTCHASHLAEALASKDLAAHYNTPDYELVGKPPVSGSTLTAACMYVGRLSTIGCYSAAKDVVKYLDYYHSKKSAAKITLVPIIKRTIQDHKITKALQNVAVKLWQRIDRKKFSKEDNIFSELRDELRAQGLSASLAKQKAVEILGSIASGGPQFAGRIDRLEVIHFPNSCKPPKSCNLNSIFMSAIAEGMVHADTFKMLDRTASPYSLPRGANFPCDSGKGYHFWMSAVLQQELERLGHSPYAARSAVLISAIGYQVKPSNDSFRGTSLLTFPRYGSLENGQRIDFIMNTAGAAFGSRLKTGTGDEDLRMASGLYHLMESGNEQPNNTADENSFGTPTELAAWLFRVAPKSAFDFYSN